jgi:ketosteroid isomerase-like protein
VPHETGDPPDALEGVEHRDEVKRAMAILSEEEREALALRYGAELSLKDVAHTVGESVTTVEGRIYRGREAEAYLTNLEEAWEEMSQSVDKVVRAGPGRYVATIRVRARSRSGLEADQLIGNVMTVRDGRIDFVESHPSVPDALRAAGIVE